MDKRDRVLHSYEEQFLRELEELRSDNAYLQSELNLTQRNLEGYIQKYERLSMTYDRALEEIEKLVRILGWREAIYAVLDILRARRREGLDIT